MSRLTLDETRELKVLMNQLRALCITIEEILTNDTVEPFGRFAGFKSMAKIYNDFVVNAKRLIKVSSMIYTLNTNEMPSYGDTLWPQAKAHYENILLLSKMLLATLEGSLDFVDDEYDNIGNFLQSRLRSVIYEKPEKEVEVQNAIESLLLGRGLSKGIDYDRESGKFEFSGKEYIPDFIIPKLNLCIEVKLLKEGRKSKMIEEISADITAYSKAYQRKLFIIYDLGVIQNEVEFKRDIESVESVKVIIVKH